MMIARLRTGILLCTILLSAIAFGGRSGVVRAQDDDTEHALATLQLYYSAVDAYDYETAWQQLGADWQKRQPLDVLTAGYADTAFVQLTTGDMVVGSDGSVTIGAKLTAWHNDKSTAQFAGSYTLAIEQGDWRIVTADIAVAKRNVVVPPLCMLDDLAFRIASWDPAAGSRYGVLVAANTSDATCVVGGTPRVSVVIPGAKTPIAVSTGEAGSPPDAIILKPGQDASADMHLSNWCVEDGESLIVYVEVPGDTWKSDIGDETDLSIPPCLGDPEDPLFTIRGFVEFTDPQQ